MPGSGTGGRPICRASTAFASSPASTATCRTRCGASRSADGSAFDRLVGTERILLAQAGGRDELVPPAHAPESLDDLEAVSRFLFAAFTQLGVPPDEHAFFMERLLTLLTSCEERRFGQCELQAWWDFVDAEHRSPAFRKLLADGLTRTLVAARAREISARTGGYILLQILFDLTRAGGRADRVLDGPTSDVWIDPWVSHLRERGRRRAARRAGRGHRLRGAAHHRRDRTAAGARRCAPTTTSRRCRSSGCGRCSAPRCGPPSRA